MLRAPAPAGGFGKHPLKSRTAKIVRAETASTASLLRSPLLRLTRALITTPPLESSSPANEESHLLHAKPQRTPYHVYVARPRAPIVLAQIINVAREMSVEFM